MKKIVCPNCGYEYLPVEIYIPKSVFGTYTHIERDIDGKILEDDSLITPMDTIESYRCDKCDKKFKVRMNVEFECVSEAMEFEEEYITKINKPNLFMKED